MMNERIRELYQQAHSIRHHDGDPMRGGNPPTVYWQGEVSAEKFAELIVRECLLCCERTISDPVPKSVNTFEQGGIHCMVEIKHHFGIE